MKYTKDILEILPIHIRETIKNLKNLDYIQEIRLKVNKPLIIQIGNDEIITPTIVSSQDLKLILQYISNYSIYAYEEEIKQGYITIKGGHRIGICGSCVIENNTIKTIKSIGSLNIRICKEIIGCSDKLIPFILKDKRVLNTIIISPPRCGKTTLLRDITRNLSEGMKDINLEGKKISVIDERSEICGCYNGVPQMNVGIHTDVFDNCPKADGIMMAIRSMSPEIIVCDEIGTYKDMESILMALNSGVNLITSIHGFGIEDLYNRIVYKDIIENNVFNIAIVLSSRNGVGTIEYIYDFEKKDKLWRR
ncbi:stage III sporulation protein AA [Clostridium sp. USBA 49]|jgi:stage III sporulation protein AA|uniref:stage III sporulation protein AA n=1 Tax=Clostridium TaxID=1485 RepID=UPI0009D4D373|nr:MULTISPECIES: stage III sporulation protein AA [Clostridium]SKA76834.1 stage III sporulation protein AA [Clostridium sp. USBA 49]